MSVAIEYPPCRRAEGIPPPACCQPPLDERIAMLERAQARADATTPHHCPRCGSPLIRRQQWLDARTWCCEEPACFAIFSERD
jgi:NAD-dependent DNA ligase